MARLMTINEAAGYMGISRRSLYRLMELNSISWYNVRCSGTKRAKRRFSTEQCDAFLMRERTMSNEEFCMQADLKLFELEVRRRSNGKR